MYFHKLLIYSLLFFSCSAASGEIYKWTDEYGRTHYGDKPKGEQAKEIEYKARPDTETSDSDSWDEVQQRQEKYLNYLQEEREARKKHLDEKQKQLAERKQVCEEAKAYQSELNSSIQFYKEDAEGNKQYLSDEEKNLEKNKAKDYIKEYCY